jgi:hypothetical protein
MGRVCNFTDFTLNLRKLPILIEQTITTIAQLLQGFTTGL